jgi:xylose isomerase
MDLFEMTQAMLVILEAGGFISGGINFDAKIRRNSTDPEDLFIAHIAGMDTMARSLLIANNILEKSPYKKMRAQRYASFDNGSGAAFENKKLTLEDLQKIAIKTGEPKQISGKQELLETFINDFI